MITEQLDTVTVDSEFMNELLSKLKYTNMCTKYSTFYLDGIIIDNTKVTLCFDIHTELWRIHIFFDVSYRDGTIDYEEKVLELGRYVFVDELISGIHNGVRQFQDKLKRDLQINFN